MRPNLARRAGGLLALALTGWLLAGPAVVALQSNLAWLSLARAALVPPVVLDQPITRFKQQLAVPSLRLPATLGLGTAAWMAGQPSETVRTLSPVDPSQYNLQLDRDYHHQLLARAYLDMDDLPRAIEELRLAGATAEGAMANGEAAARVGDWETSVRWFQAAQGLTSRPLPAEAELTLGIAWANLGEAEQARTSFERVLEQQGAPARTQAEAHYQLASLDFWLEPASAGNHFETAVGLDPGNVNAWLGWGDWYYRHQQDRDKMAMAYGQAIQLAPEAAAAWLSTAISQSNLSDDWRWEWLGLALAAADEPCRALEIVTEHPARVDPAVRDEIETQCQAAEGS
jgi:tetratricopeptide (TPR) repeat protein